VTRLKVEVTRVHNKRKLGQRYKLDLKRLSKELLKAKKENSTGDIFAISTAK